MPAQFADPNAFKLAADQMRAAAQAMGRRAYSVTLRTESYASPIADGVTQLSPSDLVMVPPPQVTALNPTDPSWYAAGIMATASARGLLTAFDITEITPAYAFLGMVIPSVTGSGLMTFTTSIPQTGITAGAFSCMFQITAAGGSGTAAWQLSTDGGATFPTSGTLGATTTALPGIGLAATPSGSFNAGDSWTFTVTCGGYTPSQLMASSPTTANRSVIVINGPDVVNEPFRARRIWSPDGYPMEYNLTVQHAGTFSPTA